jgi:hypothetical protein
MAVPLNTCTTIEQRGVVRFLWAKIMETKDIHKEMLPMYGEHCLSRQAVHNWVQKFSDLRTSIEDEHRADHCARGSYSIQKNFKPQVSRDL